MRCGRRRALSRANPNATQSGTSVKGRPAVGGGGTLARVVAHLDFDGARIGTLRPARREHEAEDLLAQASQPFRDGARAVEARIEPEVLNQAQAHHEADAGRRQGRGSGDALHLETDEDVNEADAPEFLRDATGRLAAQGFLAVEHFRLHLVEPELELPTLVIERADLGSRIELAVDEGGEQRLRLEAAPLIADGASDPCAGEAMVGRARLRRDLQLDEVVVLAETAEHAPAAV